MSVSTDHHCNLGFLVLAAAGLLFCGIINSVSTADELQSHLESGEFVSAQQVANRDQQNRDQGLADLAQAQATTGEYTSAARTLSQISSGSVRTDAIDGARNSRNDQGAAGGGSFADFDSLMQLIESTVVPDTWEALGGPSTMAPYPQGVYVDPDGTLQSCTTTAKSDSLAGLANLLEASAAESGADNLNWRQSAKMRVVSLRRLHAELLKQRFFAQPPADAMLNMAGLSRVEHVILTDGDILLAGPVGGIDTLGGWNRDRLSGLNTLRFDFLMNCLAASLNNQPFGCTIDPTPQGLQQAAAVAQGVQTDVIPVGKAAEKMKQALGLQRVEVFGTAGNTPLGYVMVEADRHMKQLALGDAEMPDGVNNYLDVIDDFIAQGPPDQLLLRLWFTASPRSVRADNDRRVFEISGNPIRLSGQNQRALATGQRGAVTQDARSDAFVAEFNKHWDDIRAKYPIYGSLESIYRVASVSELLNRFANSETHRELLSSLAAESSSSAWMMQTPKQVDSIAKYHRVRHGRQIHHVVIASGGVLVNSKETVGIKIADYPSLAALSDSEKSKPVLVQRWWWDAK